MTLLFLLSCGKQAQNPNKEKQILGKNPAQDQWQQQAARFVCKGVGKNQPADFANECPLPMRSQTECCYAKFPMFVIRVLEYTW